MSKIRLAIIGLGRWGPNHVRNFVALPDAEVVVGVDPDESSRKRIASTYGIETIPDYRVALARNDVDAAAICTPTATHAEIVDAALRAGKHVLCEKPITNRAADAWRLAALAKEKQRTLMTGHIFLFNPGIEYLADAVRTESAGRLYYIKAVRANLGPFRKDVNAAWDLASHDLYIFNHVLGSRPEWVAATGGSYLREPVEDIVFLTLKYPNGVLGHIHVSWLDPKKIREITLVGEKKMLTWDEFGSPGPILIHDRSVIRDPIYDTFGEFQLLTKEGDILVPRIPSAESLSRQDRYFIEACKNPGQPIDRGQPQQAAEVVDILEAASRSLAENGQKVTIHYGG